MKPVARFALIVVVFMTAGCEIQSGRRESIKLIGEIKNSDVIWHGTTFGWMPSAIGTTSEVARHFQAESVPQLIDALKDPDRFVAAHIILSDCAVSEYERDDFWINGLAINSGPDGLPAFQPEQGIALHGKWSEWYAKESRRVHTAGRKGAGSRP